MDNRIRVAVLIFKDGKILLVKHIHPKTGFAWWVPPGGGLQDRETLFECAQREVREETNLSITPGKVAYLRQFIDDESGRNNLEIFITAASSAGRESIRNVKGKGEDERFIKGVRYFSKEELKDVTVYPEIVKGGMWDDYGKGFPGIAFLGVETDGH